MDDIAPQIDRVTPLELFFDLVFVFTITQLTAVLYHAPSWRSLAEVAVMLAVIWWMYGGYAWLTNAVPAHTPGRRALLLAAMGGYFMLALSIPNAFHGSAFAFGLAYLFVVAVHLALFMQAASTGVVRAILELAPFNVLCALLVVAGGAAGGRAQWALWTAACLVWLSPLVRPPGAFTIGAAHFVERHGLVVIIAIGESVVAVGISAAHLAVDLRLVIVAGLGLALSACLWWLYFGGDEERAERALKGFEPVRRAWAALRGFGWWHLPMLLGIVTIAAGERASLGHPFHRTSWADAALLAGGVAAFLLGDVLYRRELGIGRVGVRVAAGVAALAVVPLGVASASAEVAALVAVLGTAIAIEAARRA
jgi:low temperature requirement protein LtrA